MKMFPSSDAAKSELLRVLGEASSSSEEDEEEEIGKKRACQQKAFLQDLFVPLLHPFTMISPCSY